MMIETLDGVACDAIPGGLVRVRRDSRSFVVRLAGEDRAWPIAPDVLRDPKAHRVGDQVRAVARSGSVWRNGQRQPDGAPGARNVLLLGTPAGWIVTDLPAVGVDGVAIDHDGQHWIILCQDTGLGAIRLRWDAANPELYGIEGAVLAPAPTSFGFLHFRAARPGQAEQVVWTDSGRVLEVGDVAWRFPQSADGLLFGQYGESDKIGGFGQDAIVDEPEPRPFTLFDRPCRAPRVASDATTVYVCAPVNDGGPGDVLAAAIRFSDPLPAWDPTGFVPPPMPLPDRVRPVWRGYTGGPDDLGRCTLGYQPGQRLPAVEAVPWANDVPDGQLLAVWYSPKEQTNLPETIAEAQRREVPIVIYHDGPGWTQGAVEEAIRAAGVATIAGIQAYPAGKETAKSVVARVLATVWTTRGRLAIIRRIDCGATRVDRPLSECGYDPAEICRLQPMLTALVNDVPDVVMDLGYDWVRPWGPAQLPVLADYFRRLDAATVGQPDPLAGVVVIVRPAPTPPTKEPLMSMAERRNILASALRGVLWEEIKTVTRTHPDFRDIADDRTRIEAYTAWAMATLDEIWQRVFEAQGIDPEGAGAYLREFLNGKAPGDLEAQLIRDRDGVMKESR